MNAMNPADPTAKPAPSSLLIRGASAIMTGLPGADARHAGPDIRVLGDRIDAIGALTPQPGEQVIDATDCVVYPAWVNTHHHLFQSLLKGDPAGLDATLTAWLAATPYRLRPLIDQETFRIAARIGLVELALSGCGTVADHNYLYSPGLSFDSSEIVFDEAERLGLRFALCRGGQTRARAVEADVPAALRPETLDAYLGDVERLAHRYHDPAGNSMRRVVVAPTTPLHAVHPAELRTFAATARRLGLRMHTHLSETVSYSEYTHEHFGLSPVQFCADHDWIGSDVWFAHLVKLSPEEIELLGSTHSGVAHCPQSNARLGSGIAPVRALADAGATISIGVDGAASNEAADMISEVHAAWLLQRAKGGEAARGRHVGGEGEAGADAATIEDAIQWGTAGGADVLGLDQVGRLVPGKAADLAIYSLAHPRYFGLHDPAIGPIACGGEPDLRALIVAGKMVVDNGALAGIDLAELAAQARAQVASLRARAG